ncbi:MAG TPA: GAF domain-containing protein, partial [Anaerolineae bacterium]|nr:GAF domain-containing protein [Anaerolineae bacterium]
DLSTYPGAVQVLEDVQPRVLRLGDPAIDDLDRVNLERLKLKALLMLPLVAQDRVIGMVELGERERDRSFSADEIRLAQTLANQAAIAITNAELFAETQRRVAELQTINAVGQAITATLPLSELVELIRREVGRVIDTSSFYIGLYDAQADRVTFPIFYDHGSRAAVDPISGGGGVTGHIIHTRRPLLLNTPEEVNLLGLPSYGDDWLSYVGVPLMIGELVTGVMAVQDADRVYAYDEGHLRILSTIASQAASVIENARLFEETQRRLREQGLLHEAGRAMSASLEYSAVLEIAADQLLRITGMQGAILFELDRDRTSLSIVHSAYLEAAGIRVAGLPGGKLALADFPHVEQAVRLRAAHLMRADDPGLALREAAYLEQAGLACALTVPMISRDQVIGVVQLVDMRSGRAFGEAYLRLIETLVNQVASAITNARLFDEVRRFTQELEARVRQRTDELATANTQLTLERDRVETLYRITSELSASLDLDRVLNRALTLVNEAVGTTRGSILLIDREANVLIHRAALGRSTPLPPAGQHTRFKPDQGLAGWVIKNRLPAIVPDIRRDDRWEEAGERDRRPYRSALAIPLVYGDDVLGALLLLHEEEDYFAETHLRLVEAAAVQVATAINNAELYGFIRESAERLGAMLRDKQVESAKAQAILESVTDGVLVADASGTVILFNAAAERILSRARSTVMGRPSADLAGLYGASGPEWEAHIRDWRDRPETRRSAPVLSHRIEFEDEKRFVTVSIAPVAGPGEEFLGTVSVFRDITAEVQADRAKSEFVSTVSHELRTPMTSIKGYADLLLMGVTGPLAENQERFVNIIKSNADRLSVLVNDLLDISRIETGRAVLDLKPVSMAAALEQVVTSLHERIEQKGLEIRTEVPEGDPLTAWADRDRMIQVLTNLISNAHQYTPSGGRITIRARATDDGMLQVDVQDTGIGIADEDQPKIFDRFFRSDDPAVQEFSGTGLGLPIVQSLVHLHGGELWVNSRLGQGATFSFTVPQAAPEARPAQF